MGAEQSPSLERHEIKDATVNELFGVLSREFGYDYKEWLDEIVALQEKWATQGYVEVYQSDEHREYGRVKDSSLAPGTSPWYIGIYHARLTDDGANDPLVVVKFHEDGQGKIVDMKLMLDHDEIFGNVREKYDSARMREIRVAIDRFISQADAKFINK